MKLKAKLHDERFPPEFSFRGEFSLKKISFMHFDGFFLDISSTFIFFKQNFVSFFYWIFLLAFYLVN